MNNLTFLDHLANLQYTGDPALLWPMWFSFGGSLFMSAMDNLIQLGRRHGNAQLLGPHTFNMPEDNELHTLIATHISGINTT